MSDDKTDPPIDTEFPVGGKVVSGMPGVEPPKAETPSIREIFDDTIARWIDDHIRSSPIAGATEAWNHLMGKLPHLKEMLINSLTKRE